MEGKISEKMKAIGIFFTVVKLALILVIGGGIIIAIPFLA